MQGYRGFEVSSDPQFPSQLLGTFLETERAWVHTLELGVRKDPGERQREREKERGRERERERTLSRLYTQRRAQHSLYLMTLRS